MINFGEKKMKISICNHLGQLVNTIESESHAKAMKNHSVNPVKKATARVYDFVTHTIKGGPERHYWLFK
jgi:hypothetical protein